MELRRRRSVLGGLAVVLAAAVILAAVCMPSAMAEDEQALEYAVYEVELAEDDELIRCRICGEPVGLKSEYMHAQDTSKAVESRSEPLLGDDGETLTFLNLNDVEVEVATFYAAAGIEDEKQSTEHSFFAEYSWRGLRCAGCKRHLGWKFMHHEHQECIDDKIKLGGRDRAVRDKSRTQQSEVEEAHRRREEIVRKQLQNKCLHASGGWWKYSVCFEQEVRQYHEEADGKRTSDWSMGKFDAEATAEANAMPPQDVVDALAWTGPPAEVVQHYSGGQKCDENGAERNSKVVFKCCASRPKELMLDAIDEPSLCSYEISVCVTELCDASPKTAATDEERVQVEEACEAEFEVKHSEGDIQPSFVGLLWKKVISDESSELDFARKLKLEA